MNRTLYASATILLSLLAASTPLLADAGPAPGGYKLTESSTYQFGCFDPCMCPIMMAEGMTGTFELTPTDASDSIMTTFAVNDVDWFVPLGDQDRLLTGSGTYTVADGQPPQQRLELDLHTNGEPAQHFDSGWVEYNPDSPAIDIMVSINGMFCFDTVLTLSALLSDPADLNLDGAVNAGDLAMLLGSWGPCPNPADCPSDLTGDADVGPADLAMLLGTWTQ